MNNHYTTWLAIFDSTLFKLFSFTKSQLAFLKEIHHPENKLKDTEITSDKPGRYRGKGEGLGTYNQESDPKEINIDNFLRECAQLLEHDRTLNHYGKLILIGPPQVYGHLKKHLSKQVEQLITHHFEKDLVHLTESNLLNAVNKLLENQ